MVDYNVVSYCRKCHKRMVHKKGQGPVLYCPPCRKIMEKAWAAED